MSEVSKARVLVVDDQDYILFALTQLLEAKGYEVRSALEGNEAIRIAKEFRPDVVLMDIALPGMNGFEVSLYLRNALELKDALVIGMSGYCSHLLPGVATRVGFDHYMPKPVDVDVLFQLLEPHVSSKRIGNGS